MEITEVKVFPVKEEKLRAFVSIVLDECFRVNDIKVISGRDGYFISMSYDFADTSFHILTVDGIRGRDKVGQCSWMLASSSSSCNDSSR